MAQNRGISDKLYCGFAITAVLIHPVKLNLGHFCL